MIIPEIISSKEIKSRELKEIYESILALFNKRGVDIQPFICFRSYFHNEEHSTEILTINLDSLLRKLNQGILTKMKIRGIGSKEKVASLAKILGEIISQKTLESLAQFSGDETKYLITYLAKDVKLGEETPTQKGISGQFQGSIHSICPFQVELILDYLFYSLLEKMGIMAIQNIWNQLEKDQINKIEANLTFPQFYNTSSPMDSGEMLYGKCDRLITQMLTKMREI